MMMKVWFQNLCAAISIESEDSPLVADEECLPRNVALLFSVFPEM